MIALPCDPVASLGAYAYRALREDGTVAAGVIEARSADEARAAVADAGMLPIDLREHVERAAHRESISASDLAIGLRMLADLLDAGLPVRRALDVLMTVAPETWVRVISHLQRSLREGRSLAVCLAEAPVVFPPLVVGIVAAGEAGPGLRSAVRRAAELTEAAAAMRASVRAALAYPLVLAITTAVAVCFMVGVVLPRFAAVLADFHQTLPWSTRRLFQVATIARQASVPALALMAGVAIGVHTWTATARGRRQWHALLLRVPLIGDARFAVASARAAFTLASLLEAGVTIRRSLVFAGQASGDAEVEARLLLARDRIARGEPAAPAFAATSALTPLIVRLAAAGEESGRFAGMLLHAASLEQARCDRMLRAAVRLLEPALVLGFAAIVAMVAVALLQAVYSVRPT